MNEAIVFSKDSVFYNQIVTAEEVQTGKIGNPKKIEFAAIDYNFAVRFWSESAPGKEYHAPHFKIYHSLEDYKKMTPEERKELNLPVNDDELENVFKRLSYHQDSEWHKSWKERFAPYAIIEKNIKNEKGEYKRPDAHIEENNTVIEFQHSFNVKDFYARTRFYDELGYNLIWVYDLTNSSVNPISGSNKKYYILENNAYDFFRIADNNQENLLNYPTLIHASDGYIYHFNRLDRKVDNPQKGTVREFTLLNRYTKEELINAILRSDITLTSKAYRNKNNLEEEYCSYFAHQEAIYQQQIEKQRLQAEKELRRKKEEDDRCKTEALKAEEFYKRIKAEEEKKKQEAIRIHLEKVEKEEQQRQLAAEKKIIKEKLVVGARVRHINDKWGKGTIISISESDDLSFCVQFDKLSEPMNFWYFHIIEKRILFLEEPDCNYNGFRTITDLWNDNYDFMYVQNNEDSSIFYIEKIDIDSGNMIINGRKSRKFGLGWSKAVVAEPILNAAQPIWKIIEYKI